MPALLQRLKAPSAARLDGGETDHALMAAVAVGDVRAFAVLSDRYLRPMVALAQRVLGNAADADEVAQEAFLRLWTHAATWDPEGPGSLKTWLSRIVVNLCIDRQRKKKPEPLDETKEYEDPAPSSHALMEEKDRKRFVQGLLDALPERQRTAVVLSYFEEMSGADVAAAMSLSVGAVESLLVRARRHLRAACEKAGFLRGEVL